MKPLIQRILIVPLMAILFVPALGQAATGPWNWTDISSQLTVRSNRPIWAIAHSNQGWFYTDGQDLWNGGQVYRFDGQTQVNITNDVRNAGISRVDDIVSDNADTVLFLQDVVRLDNTVKVIVYKNGAYTNRTSVIQNSLATNEGLSTITGRDGAWHFFTTKGKLFKWNADGNTPSRIQLPVVTTSVDTESLYYVHMNSQPNMLVPVRDAKWLVSIEMERDAYNRPTKTALYSFDGTTFTLISNSFTLIRHLESNGQDAIFMSVGRAMGIPYTGFLKAYENNEVRNIQLDETINNATRQAGWNGFCPASWNGSSWMVMCTKSVFRITNDTITKLADTRDYFVTLAGDNAGHFLLGGAVSEVGNPNPTNPLTAKLVMVTEGTVSTPSTPASGKEDPGTGINRWEWVTPDITTFKNAEIATYGAGAWDNDGLKKIDLYVNGVIAKSCVFGNLTGNQECAFALDARNYAQNTNVFVNAKVTDATDRFTWTTGKNIRRENDTMTPSPTPTPGTTVGEVNAWSSFDHALANRNDSTRFATGAWASRGLNRVELIVNGTVKRSCNFNGATGNQTCDLTINGSDYTAGTNVSANAKAVDVDGREAWSTIVNLWIPTETGSTPSPTPAPIVDSTPDVWDWVTSGAYEIETFEVVHYLAGAWDEDGIKTIRMYVDGKPMYTCNYFQSHNIQECYVELKGANYANGQTIFVNAEVVDWAGRTTWTTGRNFTIRRSL